MPGKGPKVIIVGAGIIGASIAWHLTRAGARVTILDASEPGGVATPNSFSWINSNYSFARDYFVLRHHSMGEWRRLFAALPRLPGSLSGSIYLPAQGLDLEEFVTRNSAWGYRIELIDSERVKRLEPNLILASDIAAHAPDEGAVEASEVAEHLAEAAVDEGAVLRSGVRVDGLVLGDARVTGVRAGDEIITADEVVVAAGVATPELVSQAGYELPLTMPPGLLAHTNPVSRVLNGLVLSDGLHMRQKANGQILAGSDFEGAELADDPESGGEELVRRLRAALNTGEPLTLDRTTTGYRPTPADGMPVIGRAPGVSGLYVAVMHSGVTLCPAVGAMASEELLAGNRHELLASFSPERFRQQQLASG
jgi:glycine/D-amino acid oxidase-like deaminating enzyme